MRLAVALICLIAPTVRAQTADSVAWGLPAWWAADEQTQFLAREARAAAGLGLAPLATTPLPEGVREIRVRQTSSTRIPLIALRLVDDGTAVSDTAWLWWSSLSDSLVIPMLGSRCAVPTRRDGMTTCPSGRSATMLSPAALLARFDALRIGLLSGEVPQEPPAPGTLRIRGDGETIAVEIRDGARYRAYTYWSPRDDRGADEAAMAAIYDLSRMRTWSGLPQ